MFNHRKQYPIINAEYYFSKTKYHREDTLRHPRLQRRGISHRDETVPLVIMLIDPSMCNQLPVVVLLTLNISTGRRTVRRWNHIADIRLFINNRLQTRRRAAADGGLWEGVFGTFWWKGGVTSGHLDKQLTPTPVQRSEFMADEYVCCFALYYELIRYIMNYIDFVCHNYLYCVESVGPYL